MAGKTVTALAGGWYHTCAIAGGAVYCWGQNDYGQLGDQTSTDRWVPVAALGDLAGTTATAIATGHHTCVIANGAAMCWGYNAEGQLGRGTSGWGVNHTPVALGASDVLQGRTLAAVAGNGNHVVVLAASKPGSPRNPVATAGDGQVTVGWAAPAWDGGIPITGYKVTSTGGPSCSTTALSCEVTGLTNGVEYQFSIVATNALGDSAAVTVKATPLAPQSPPPIPTAPAPTPGQTAPAAQSVKRPPAKVKHGKSTSLAVKTAQGARVTWKTTTKKICTVKKAKLRAKKKGKCKLVATASAVPGHATLSQRFTVKIT